MTTSRYRYSLPVATLAAISALPAVAAEEPTLEQLAKPDSHIEVGATGVYGHARGTGIYTGANSVGTYPSIDGSLRYRDEASGTWTRLDGNIFSNQNGQLKYEFEKQGDWIYSLEASRAYYTNPRIISTRIDGLGTDSNNPTNGRNHDVELRLRRDDLKVSGTKAFKEDWDVTLSAKEDRKFGKRQTGVLAASGFNFAVEPIEYVTKEYQANLSFSGKQFQMEFGYLGSFFKNENEVLETVSTSEPLLSLPLDNQAHKLYFNGGYSFTPTTRGTVHASYGRYLQDENFFGQPGLNTRKNLGGKVDNTLLNAGLTTRPTNDLSARFKLRYDERNDNTAQARYLATSTSRTGYNLPFSRRTETGDGEFDYRLPNNFKLIGGLGYERWYRDSPPIRQTAWRLQTDETTARIALRRPLVESLSGSVGFQHSERHGSDLQLDETNAIDPILWANRERDKLRATLDWSPTQDFTLQLIGEEARDQYGARLLGPQEGRYRFISIDGNYHFAEAWDASAWASWNSTTIEQRTRNSSNTNWQANLEHTGYAFGTTLTGRLTDEFKLITDLTHSEDTSKHHVSSLNGVTTGLGPPLADIVYKQWILTLTGDYSLNQNHGIKAKYGFAHLSAQDWSYTGYTYADGTTVKIPETENVHFVGLSYYFKW